MKGKFLKLANREYSFKQRLIALMLMAPIFPFLLPYIFIRLGAGLNQWLKLPSILPLPFNWILGGLLILPGGFLAFWSIYSQFTIGRGTPLPVMATQKLVIQPPFSYCRNPMVLGTILVYLGVAVLFHSMGAGIVALLFAALLLILVKRVEERELELRFGEDYLNYKRQTPFLIPRFRKYPHQPE